MLFLSVAFFLSVARLSLAPQEVALELRLDLFDNLEVARVEEFLRTCKRPVMLTLRKVSQGGKFEGTEPEREALIEQLLALEPPFFDLEWEMRPQFMHEMIDRHPKTQFILSYHNFQGVPADLEGIYQAMSQYPAFSYKMAVMTHSTSEALKMLLFARSHPKTSVICMGEAGKFARVLGPIFGNLVDYACLDEEGQIAPGQLTLSEWMDIYRYPSLNRETAIFGLIGDPVEKSVGHIYHNGVFQRRDLNAVYVKMRVKPEELAEFVPLAASCMRGLSVTMPHKEAIVPFLDAIEPAAKQMGAVNTLLLDKGKILGTNTDGPGALDAIEKKLPIRGKKVVLLGAGGAARAIAFEAKWRGADLVVLNRNVQRAEALAAGVGGSAGGLDEVPAHYDVLINCTPDPLPIDSQTILPGTVAMDVVRSPKETLFLKEAALKACQIVYGEEMFVNQAIRQTAFWTGN